MSDNKTYENKKVAEAEPAGNSNGGGGQRYMRYDTMIIGLLLIVFGAFLLYTNYDPKFDFREIVLTWWPLIFVIVGVVKIIQSVAGVPGKGSGVGWLVFGGIVLLLISGVHWSDWDDDFQIGFFSHQKVKEESTVIELSGQETLILDLNRSDVKIYGYSGNELRITEKVFVRGRDSDELEEKAEKFELGVSESPEAVTISSNPLNYIKNVNSIYVELEIEVPENMKIEFVGVRSDIFVKGFDGALLIRSEIGDVTLDSVDGPVDITINRADVDLNKLTGKVEIRGKRIEIDLVNVYGELIIDTERSSIELTNYEALENDILIRTTRASVELNLDSKSSFRFDGKSKTSSIYYEFDDIDESYRHEFSQEENDGDHRVTVTTNGGSISVEEI